MASTQINHLGNVVEQRHQLAKQTLPYKRVTLRKRTIDKCTYNLTTSLSQRDAIAEMHNYLYHNTIIESINQNI